MRRFRILTTALAGLIGVLWCHAALAGIVTFGGGPNTFTMEFVPIGNPGNAADTMGNPSLAGSVGYAYNIGKYEVSRDMVTKANAEGDLGITMDTGTSSVFTRADQPATSVTWFEAARFVNWLNTSQGFQAAYNFDNGGNFQLWSSAEAWQLDGENLFRHKDARYWLPSMDEWYKAAYYDPVSNTYFNFPTGSNTAPTAVAGGITADTAVYGQSPFSGPADIMNAGGLSPFGTMGQGGNVWEWEETARDLSNNLTTKIRGVRGGGWSSSDGLSLLSSSRSGLTPATEFTNFGFRVASLSSDAEVVPEPNSLIVWTLTGLGGLWWGRRRLRK